MDPPGTAAGGSAGWLGLQATGGVGRLGVGCVELLLTDGLGRGSLGKQPGRCKFKEGCSMTVRLAVALLTPERSLLSLEVLQANNGAIVLECGRELLPS